jgi:inhibitor of cysteine peptidase
MKKFFAFSVLCIVLLVAGFSAGCMSKTTPATPATTVPNATAQIPGPVTTVTMPTVAMSYFAITESQNKAIHTLPVNEMLYVKLDENLGTGYFWNATVTPGLAIVNETYVPPISGNGMGSSGTHVWQIKATSSGDQKFVAILKRPIDATTGRENTYTLFLTVP